MIDDYFFLQKMLVITYQENASGISSIQAEFHRLLDKARFNSRTGPLNDPNCLINLKTVTVILLFFFPSGEHHKCQYKFVGGFVNKPQSVMRNDHMCYADH